MQHLVTGPVIGLTWLFNLYKFSRFFLEEYRIFPWSTPGQLSSSPSLWLSIHLVSALLLQFVTGLRLQDERFAPIHRPIHYLFCGLVLINVWHFGEASYLFATLLQGSLIAVMLWRQQGWIYFFTLSSAPLLEIALFIRTVF